MTDRLIGIICGRCLHFRAVTSVAFWMPRTNVARWQLGDWCRRMIVDGKNETGSNDACEVGTG